MQGGILYRLARNTVRPVEVSEGPSYTIATRHLANKDSIPVGDDLLTRQEIDILCGVYHVITRK